MIHDKGAVRVQISSPISVSWVTLVHTIAVKSPQIMNRIKKARTGGRKCHAKTMMGGKALTHIMFRLGRGRMHSGSFFGGGLIFVCSCVTACVCVCVFKGMCLRQYRHMCVYVCSRICLLGNSVDREQNRAWGKGTWELRYCSHQFRLVYTISVYYLLKILAMLKKSEPRNWANFL